MNNIWIDEVGKIDEKTFNDLKPLPRGEEKGEEKEEDCPFCGRTPCTEECIEASFPTKP